MNATWFGDAPEGWHAVPLYGIASERQTPNKGLRETNLLSLSYGRIIRKDIETNQGLLPASFETYQIVDPDNIVLRMTDLQNDQRSLRSALVGETGIITSAYLALALRGVDPRFMAYQFRAIDLMKVFYSMGGGLRQSIGFDDLKRLLVLSPPLEEQRAIADYLDRETAQIDAFIAKNEELITLLTERRASVIGSAVTRGIDERAELSTTGPEWIGPVPTAWTVQPIKSAYSVVVGKMLNESKSEGEPVPYVRAANIQPEGLDLSDVKEMKATAAERRALALRSGDVVFVEGGGGYGRSDYLRQDLPGWVFQNHVIRLRSRPGHDGRFLNYWLQHVRRLGHYEALSAFATIPNVSGDKLGRIEMPVPPLLEQREIVKHIEEATSRIDAAVAVAQRSVKLARERRAALISSAVTGKIDVGVAT